MKKKRKRSQIDGKQQLIVVLSVLLVAIVVLASAFVMLYKPSEGILGPGTLPFDTETDSVTPPPSAETDPADTDTTGDSSSSGPVYTPREEVYNFLLIGHDRVSTLADVIMLVNYDVANGKVSLMQLPRDTYFRGDSNKPHLNVQFSAYYNRAFLAGDKNAAATAAEKFAVQLEKNLCINIHYTAVMNLDGFAGIVNAIGGVDLYIPYDMDYEDPEQDLYIHFKEGQTHLTGKDAEKFVRFRDGFVQADIGRGNAQKLFMAAFIDKAKSSVSLTNVSLLTNLVNEILANLTTDMPAADAVYFAKNALKVDMKNITMLTIPGDSVAGHYVINRGAALAAINAYFNVYDNDIIDAIFDKGCVFTDSSSLAISAAYTAENAALINEYNAANIRQNSIKIPLKTEKPEN